MNYRVHHEADSEQTEAFDYLEQQSYGLGKRFNAEISYAIQRICEHPFACQELECGARRRNLVKFPYGIFYVIENKEIIIIAFAHWKRDPNYWLYRLPQNTH